MRSQSGCFGSSKQVDDVVDTVEEVSAVVGDIAATDAATAATEAACQLAVHYASMERRIRLLTWAVGIIAAVLVRKEFE